MAIRMLLASRSEREPLGLLMLMDTLMLSTSSVETSASDAQLLRISHDEKSFQDL